MKPSLNFKLRNLAVLFLLMLSIGFIIYNFGTADKDLDTFSRIRTLTTSNKMFVPSSSFWDDKIDIEVNIPDDVLLRAEKVVIDEKTVLVDVEYYELNVNK